MMTIQTSLVQIGKIESNTGQIPGLPKNPRFIKDQRYKKLVKSIKDLPEMMDLRPLLVYQVGKKYVTIGGNMRFRAISQLKWAHVPCIVIPAKTSTKTLKEIAVKDNVAFGEDDWDLLKKEWTVGDLSDWGLDLPDFNTNPSPSSGEDDFKIQAKIKTNIKSGDLIEIGRHRLVCGDSTKQQDVSKLLSGKVPILMVTDPPYGVNYDADWRNKRVRTTGGPPIGGRATGKVVNDQCADWQGAYALFPGDIAYVWHAGTMSKEVFTGLQKSGFNICMQMIWVKSNFAIGRSDYHPKHEPCAYAIRKGKKHNWQGSRKETTVWEIPKPAKSETGHSTQKPVECMARPIRNNTKQGESVYDPFHGSGTTMVASEQLGRICYAMEISPDYCQVTIDRMLNLCPKIDIKVNGKPYKGGKK